MAEISLRDYLAKLDTLLKSGSAAEVILHCRHILQYFPKNAQAYRLLGQALVATSRWQEAGEVMRRVLSVFPDDRDAHAGLSEVYRIEKRSDDSIWHLERAFEQTPNDQTILDNLRELYRKFHKVEHGKVQLTSAAVARQYIRNGLYEQAIDTLQKARTASPERIDIPLLLAQTYWDRGQQVEAAEMALEVLRVLPDCLVANTLLAAMWLTEARPSDAQRYIGRIESLDPYLALELAQGQDVPDNAFKLPELDYQRAAEREMNLQTPDWLDMTGNADIQAPVEEDTDAVPDFFSEITPEDVIAKQSFDVPLTSADWATPSDDVPYVDNEPTVRKSTGLTGRLDKPPTGSLPSVPGAKRGLTGHLTPIPEQMPQPEPAPADDFSSFMQEFVSPSDEVAAPTQAAPTYTSDLPDLESLVPGTPDSDDLPFRRERTIQPEDNDPLAWLRSSGVEINEETPDAGDDDIFDAEFDSASLTEADAADPLSWLQGYGGNDLVVDQPTTTGTSFKGTDDLPVPEDQSGDPLAWLQSTEPASAFPSAAPSSSPSHIEDDPLDWLSDDSLLDEAFDLESLVNNQPSMPEQPSEEAVSSMAATPDWQDTMADEKDPLDWLSSDPEPEAEPSDSFTWMDEAQDASATPNEEFPDWLNAAASNTEVIDASVTNPGDDMNWMTDLPDLVTNEASEPAQPTNTGMLDWLGKEKVDTPAPNMPSMEQPDVSVPDWLGELNTETSSEPTASHVDENGFEWMSMAEELPPVPSASDFPDWLSESGVGTGVEPLAADTPDWLSSMDTSPEPAAENQPRIVADTPDWLSSMDASEEQVDQPPVADTPDWLSSMSASAEAEDEPLGIADAPDWLSSIDAAEEPTIQSPGYSDTPDWLSSTSASPEPAQADEPHIIADTPDWLSSVDAAEAPAEPMIAADTPDWLSELRTEEPESTAGRNMPDWMSRAEPKATTDALIQASNIHEWASGLAEDEEQPAEPIAAADAPEWLSDLQPEESEPQPEAAASSDIPDWLSGMDMGDAQEAQPEPMAADAPDWLSDLQPEEPEQEPEAEPLAAAEAPDWLTAMQPEEVKAEPEPAAASDAPDWLSSMDFTEEPEQEPEAEPLAAAETPDWLTVMQPEEVKAEPEPAATSDAPDWLSSMDFTEEPEQEPEAEPLAAAEAPDWLSAMQPVEAEPEPAAASDAPDWLSSMDFTEEQEPEAEPLAAAETPDWLSAMQPVEAEPEPEAEPLAAAETPDWLTAMQPADEEEPEAEPLAAETPDWLSAMQPEETKAEPEPEAEPLAAAETPDWLTAMQPADEEEPEAEPLAAAEAPDWLSAMQPVEAEPEPEAEPLAAAETPDWLTAMQPADEEEPEAEPLAAETPDWLSAMQPEETKAEPEPEPLAIADTPDWLSAMQPEDEEPEAEPVTDVIPDDTPDWLTAMQQPTEPVVTGERVPVGSMTDVLNSMPTEPVPDAEQPLNDEEWTEAAELESETMAEGQDWLAAMNTTTETEPANDENKDTFEWDDAPAEESMPAAPAPASNAPDWLNAMVPGLDVDYEAPEDEPVETEFLPTNKKKSAPPAPAKETNVRPEFGWLLDIVDEESQQVTVVADKNALRRFVFSRRPNWLRKPTEKPDKSTVDEGETADNVDIPPWLQ